MTDRIGPTFRAELIAAGIAHVDGMRWLPATGDLIFDDVVTEAERVTAAAVLAAHDPTQQLPPPYVAPTPREWMARLSDEKQMAVATAATGSPALMLWMFRLMGATFVDVTDAETIAGVNIVVAADIGLTADDAALLLAP